MSEVAVVGSSLKGRRLAFIERWVDAHVGSPHVQDGLTRVEELSVTTISGVPLGDDALRELAGRLKKRCGVGGSAEDGVIELQGDHRDAVVALLRADGYDVVLAGG
jgi:predicted translation initiation factor SUI1